ncbi:hypothetical protein NCCP2495_16810 [Dietzia sp. NCCP-2495]|uniref:hypothetical protein n=1 Tax=Dietzia sp. NCCP-2495 TaxID=2934675 RepID=UPI00222F2635|nr:hypothetical protein [Dietzia sp. NCCP-2495]GLB63802.1 hypothetical protein NCCP2495_16810 [Dietzia sp. NCCP-2495]
MSTRDELDWACRDETELALELHDHARPYLAGDVGPEKFLDAAHRYGLARLHRERLQDALWGEP